MKNREEQIIVSKETAEIDKRKLEKENLAQQVKQMVKAEGKLYKYQEKLDAQLKEYKELYELSRKISSTFDILKIFEYSSQYIVHKLEYERVIFFEQFEYTGNYAVCALDGYYDQEEKSSVAALVIKQDDPFLSPLVERREHLICKAGTAEKELVEYRSKLIMDEYLIYPLCSHNRPHAFLAVGNSAANSEFYRRISDGDGALLSMGNLAGLLVSAVENHIYHINMQAALQQEKRIEEKYRGIFENAAEGILQTTPDGRFINCNPAAAVILGYASPAELIEGVPTIAQLYVSPRRRSELYDLMHDTGEVKNFEVEFYRKDGSKQWVLVSTRPVFNENREILYVDGMIQDISERKRAEEEHLSHLAFLESLERVDRVIRRAESIEGMMTDVLDTALSIFASDRAWLLYPCDPEAPMLRVPMERTRAGYPGALAMGIDLPMTPELSEPLRAAIRFF